MKTHFFILTLLLVVFSCKKDKTPNPPVEEKDRVQILLEPSFGDGKLKLDSTYVTSEGYKIQFSEIKFFAHQWKNGEKTLVEVAFFDYRAKGSKFIEAEKKHTDFNSISGFIGIEETVNHSDPTAYPNNHPLNIVNAGGMHWGWNPGYIFIKVEGRMDTIPGANENFDHFLVYHAGLDSYLRTVEFESVPWKKVNDKLHRSTLKLDLNNFFNDPNSPINPKTEFLTHSGPAQLQLTEKVVNNFKNSLSFIE
jgi:hypothetical protein